MIKRIVENASNAFQLQHVVNALSILVGKREMGHIVIFVAHFTLRFRDDHRLTAVGICHGAVDDVQDIDFIGPEQFVGPCSHGSSQDTRVSFELSCLLHLV